MKYCRSWGNPETLCTQALVAGIGANSLCQHNKNHKDSLGFSGPASRPAKYSTEDVAVATFSLARGISAISTTTSAWVRRARKKQYQLSLRNVDLKLFMNDFSPSVGGARESLATKQYYRTVKRKFPADFAPTAVTRTTRGEMGVPRSISMSTTLAKPFVHDMNFPNEC